MSTSNNQLFSLMPTATTTSGWIIQLVGGVALGMLAAALFDAMFHTHVVDEVVDTVEGIV